MSKDIAKVWEFPSGSNPNKRYETLRYTDGTTSCNCFGWTRRVAADGTRSCKHTRLVHMGLPADRECTSSHDYTSSTPRQATTQANLAAPKKKEKAKGPKMTVIGTRRVAFIRKPQTNS